MKHIERNIDNIVDSNYRFIIISKQNYDWLEVLRGVSDNVIIITEEDKIGEILNRPLYDVIFYADGTFEGETASIVEEIKNRSPQILISVITSAPAGPQRDALFAAGADDVILPDMDIDSFFPRLDLLIRQHIKNHEHTKLTRKLQHVSMLAHTLHEADNPRQLIDATIQQLCIGDWFGVSEVAITILNGDTVHVYAGTRDVSNQQRLHEGTIALDDNDPLCQVIRTSVSLIFEDIASYPHYKQLPIIKNPRKALILPLKHGGRILGSVGLFSHSQSFTVNDLGVFELFASHFSSAYTNVRYHFDREEEARYKQRLLRAWQSLTLLDETQKVAEYLTRVIFEIDVVQSAATWVTLSESNKEKVVFAADGAMENFLRAWYAHNQLRDVIDEFDPNMRPLILESHWIQRPPLAEIFHIMDVDKVVLFPINSSNIFMGGVFVAAKQSRPLTSQVYNMIESLAYAAAQTLERNMLISDLQSRHTQLQAQTGRLEVILRSIDEAIFFVEHSQRVVFCNPQFTELTGISPSRFIGKNYEVLLNEIAQRSDNPDDLAGRFAQALQQLFEDGEQGYYPIIEVERANEENILIEFNRLHGQDGTRNEWIGFIQSAESAATNTRNANFDVLNHMIDDVTMPLTTLRQTVGTVIEQYNNMARPKVYTQLLNQLERQVRDIQSMWANFTQVYTHELEGITLNANKLDSNTFLSGLIDTLSAAKWGQNIRFQAPPMHIMITADERLLQQAFMNIMRLIISTATPNVPITITNNHDQTDVIIAILSKSRVVRQNDLSSLSLDKVDMSSIAPQLLIHRPGIYLSKRIIEEHQGQIAIEQDKADGIAVQIKLPLTDVTEVKPVQATPAAMSTSASTKDRLNILVYQGRYNFIQSLYPELDQRGHEVYVEQYLDESLELLQMTKIDVLIVLADVDDNPSEIVRQVRHSSDVPILIIATAEAEPECIYALENGADQYMLNPINKNQFFAQLNSLAERIHLHTRTAEPIEAGDLYIDLARRRVYQQGKLVNLTKKEYELLRVLVKYKGRVRTHSQLLGEIWGPEYRDDKQYLWVNISRLRSKIEVDKKKPRHIITEPGIGYIFQE